MTQQEEIKYPLGENLFVTFTKWRGFEKIHIRRYKVITSSLNKTTVLPTRQGVCSTLKQLEQIVIQAPFILSAARQRQACVNSAALYNENSPTSIQHDHNEIDDNLPTVGHTEGCTTNNMITDYFMEPEKTLYYSSSYPYNGPSY